MLYGLTLLLTKRAFQAIEGLFADKYKFNQNGKSRREWQQSLALSNGRFSMATKVFTLKKGTKPTPTSSSVHPWLLDAVRQNTRWVPNEQRPIFLEKIDNKRVRVDTEGGSIFERDDIIWVSFRLAFTITNRSWGPEITPLAFVKTGHISTSDVLSTPNVDDSDEDKYDLASDENGASRVFKFHLLPHT